MDAPKVHRTARALVAVVVPRPVRADAPARLREKAAEAVAVPVLVAVDAADAAD